MSKCTHTKKCCCTVCRKKKHLRTRRKKRTRSVKRVRPSTTSLLQQSVNALGVAIGSLTDRVARIEAAIHRNRIELGEVRSTVVERNTEEDSIRSQLQQRIGQEVTVDTPAGAVSGVLIAVGEDFIQLQESTGAILVVRIPRINSIS